MAAADYTANRRSTAFTRLNARIQRWIWEQNWTELRDAQERAIGPILDGDSDIIITAATAAGKTEAAFLPICSALLDPANDVTATLGVKALYVSPLKALINDQY